MLLQHNWLLAKVPHWLCPAGCVLHSALYHHRRHRGELLRVCCKEADLAHTSLQVLLLNQASQRAVARGSLRLSGLLPGQHYSLALALTDTCTLYMTVVLGLGVSTLLAALQGPGLAAAAAASAGKLQLAQVGLPLLDRPLESLLKPAMLQQGAAVEVLAVWKGTTGSTPGVQQQKQEQQPQPLQIQVDGREGSEAAGAAALRQHNSSTGLLAVGGPSRAGSATSSRDGGAADSSSNILKGLSGVLAVMPIFSSEQQEALWPQEHQVGRALGAGAVCQQVYHSMRELKPLKTGSKRWSCVCLQCNRGEQQCNGVRKVPLMPGRRSTKSTGAALLPTSYAWVALCLLRCCSLCFPSS